MNKVVKSLPIIKNKIIISILLFRIGSLQRKSYHENIKIFLRQDTLHLTN